MRGLILFNFRKAIIREVYNLMARINHLHEHIAEYPKQNEKTEHWVSAYKNIGDITSVFSN